MTVWTSFDLRSNLGLTRGILVILAKKCTLGAPVTEQAVQRHSGCSHGPKEKEIIFLDFSGSSTQIKGGQNTVSTHVPMYVPKEQNRRTDQRASVEYWPKAIRRLS